MLIINLEIYTKRFRKYVIELNALSTSKPGKLARVSPYRYYASRVCKARSFNLVKLSLSQSLFHDVSENLILLQGKMLTGRTEG